MDTKAKILDIAMNLNRIGNWAADGYTEKRGRIDTFLRQTSDYIESIDPTIYQKPFGKTIQIFVDEYQKLRTSLKDKNFDELFFAEKMMTWGNILTHRAKLL